MGAHDQYDSLAEDYDWLFSDRTLTGEPQVGELQPILERLPPGARILDSACGTGLVAFALARHGFRVRGTDASVGMITSSRRNATGAAIQVPFDPCRWEDLPGPIDERFDLVLCGGNAIGHCRDEAEMLRSLRGLRRVLADGGLLVVDSRNWEKLRRERVRFTHFGQRLRDGIRCVPVYVWTFPEEPTAPHTIDVLLVLEQGGNITLRSYPITYYPFRYDELAARLTRAGFTDLETDFAADQATYHVVARAA